MTPDSRTPQQRDRRFARVRRITQTILIGSGAASGLFVGYAASIAKPLTVIPFSANHAGSSGATPTTTTTIAPVAASGDDSTGAPAAATPYTPPSSAPAAATTTCYSTPSGQRVCY